MSGARVGIGHDTHRLAPPGPLRLGGITIPFELGPVGHSDADVLLHAIIDAVTGAAGLPDIGELFPNSDSANRGRDSAEMLALAWERVRQSGYRLGNLDAIVFAEKPKLSPHKKAIRERLAELLGAPLELINIKAKTGEGVDAVGRLEAIMAQAVVLLERT